MSKRKPKEVVDPARTDDPDAFVLTIQDPVVKKAKPKPPTVQGLGNPYRVEQPAMISFSGGRTSAYMLKHIIDAFGGQLPEDVVVTFANTGKEREETLMFVEGCAQRWGVKIVWIEFDLNAEGKFKVVDYQSASRKGQPFEALVEPRGYLPNVVTRMCTADLKIKPMAAYMKSLGYDEWTSVVGLRYDEPSRVAKIYAPKKEPWESAAPLYHARVTKADVMAFWAEQEFDLGLDSYEGNCDLCFLKGVHRRARIMFERPDAADWWIAMEKKTGHTFVKPEREPGGYAAMARKVRSLPMIPQLIDEEDDSIDCACTD